MAVYSSIKNIPVDSCIAMTGEISIRGKIKPVGGVSAKVEAARVAGVKRVIIPKENWQVNFSESSIEVIAVEDIMEAIHLIFEETEQKNTIATHKQTGSILSAQGI